jgi:hypothetical protein
MAGPHQQPELLQFQQNVAPQSKTTAKFSPFKCQMTAHQQSGAPRSTSRDTSSPIILWRTFPANLTQLRCSIETPTAFSLLLREMRDGVTGLTTLSLMMKRDAAGNISKPSADILEPGCESTRQHSIPELEVEIRAELSAAITCIS